MFTMSIDLVNGLLAVGGTILGYSFREYQNRIVPFFQVYKIDGNLLAGWEPCDVPKDICADLSNSFYVGQLKECENVGEVYKSWDNADDIKQCWPEIKSLVIQLCSTTTDVDLEEAIYKLFCNQMFDNWFTRLVARSELHFEQSSKDLPERIFVEIDPNDQKNGVIWINTTFGATTLGQQMNNPAMRQRFERFIHNIQTLDSEKIKKTLKEFRIILEKEYEIALKVITPLKKIIDSYSQWAFYIAFTNLSNQPALIEQNVEVYIFDEKKELKKPYKLDCKLAKLVDDKVRSTAAPISFKPGETLEFAIVSRRPQCASELGDDIRTVFDRESGKCMVVLHLQKPGLLKTQKINSSKIIFKQSEAITR